MVFEAFAIGAKEAYLVVGSVYHKKFVKYVKKRAGENEKLPKLVAYNEKNEDFITKTYLENKNDLDTELLQALHLIHDLFAKFVSFNYLHINIHSYFVSTL